MTSALFCGPALQIVDSLVAKEPRRSDPVTIFDRCKAGRQRSELTLQHLFGIHILLAGLTNEP